jgi:hypothetical protein
MLRAQIRPYVLAAIIGAMGFAHPGSAFECPEPQAQSVPSVIPESPQAITELGDLLRSGDLENRLEVTARDLKRKYPKADKTELTNYMVTAYCRIVAADQGLSDFEKRERLDQFSKRVWEVYSELGL